jgi:Arc/MetJ-type ribon-helix-helix transcriptional regulator
MHVHVIFQIMRTTIEMSEVHRAALLRLAAERRQKGFSGLVAEAIDAYLGNLGVGDERVGAQRLRGVLSASDAEELEARTRAVRESWR